MNTTSKTEKQIISTGVRECLPNKHKRRDNKFGITWCVRCGQLFSKPVEVELKEHEKIIYICNANN